MHCSPRIPLLLSLACFSGSVLQATVIQFSGNYLPNDADPTHIEFSNGATNDALLTTVRFSGTSWVSENGYLKLTTAPSRGIWFGTSNNNYGDDSAFLLSGTDHGNSLTVAAKLLPDSKSWETFFYDQDGYLAYLTFEYIESGFNRPGVWGNINGVWKDLTPVGFDLTEDNLFTSHVYQGEVAYFINGELVGSGTAIQNPSLAGLTLIGDGSGSTRTGTGSMLIDWFALDNAAGPFDAISLIPEPSSFAVFLSLGGLASIFRRRR